MNEKFVLCVNEYDFAIDGYTIRKLDDIRKVVIDKKCQQIANDERIFSNIQVPNINIKDWNEIFSSLKNLNINIIVECEGIEQESKFYIGKIEDVNDEDINFRSFDNDGIWDNETEVIQYKDITSMTFKTRYLNVFSKYLDK